MLLFLISSGQRRCDGLFHSLSLSWDSKLFKINDHVLRLPCSLRTFAFSAVTSLSSEGKVEAAWSKHLPSPSSAGGGVRRRWAELPRRPSRVFRNAANGGYGAHRGGDPVHQVAIPAAARRRWQTLRHEGFHDDVWEHSQLRQKDQGGLGLLRMRLLCCFFFFNPLIDPTASLITSLVFTPFRSLREAITAFTTTSPKWLSRCWRRWAAGSQSASQLWHHSSPEELRHNQDELEKLVNEGKNLRCFNRGNIWNFYPSIFFCWITFYYLCWWIYWLLCFYRSGQYLLTDSATFLLEFSRVMHILGIA